MSNLQRLSKVLAAAGVASRRACETLIFEGKVSVNGAIVRVPQTPVSGESDEIRVEGRTIRPCDKKIYYLVNKPFGYTCSNTRIGRKKLVVDLFSAEPYRLFTVGRLDRDTTGLLIVTNDGHFANQVIHPSANLTKEYLIKVQQEVTHDHLVAISQGTIVEGSYVKPVRVSKVRKGTLKIAVKEGKKREVRLLVAKAGLELLELKRIRIGGLSLGTIPPGGWREMTEQDRRTLFQ